MYSVPASLLQPLVICATVSACCLHNLHLGSCTVWLVSCATALVLRACSDVAFIEPLICASYVCSFWHTFVPGTMQRLLIPGWSFIWLFRGGCEALPFSLQRITFCLFYWYRTFRLCSSWLTTFSMLCRPVPPFFLLVYSLDVLDLEWNTPCMVMSFLVPMSISFRSSCFQLTTATGY